MSRAPATKYHYRKRNLAPVEIEEKFDKPWEAVTDERRTRLFNIRMTDRHWLLLRHLADASDTSMQEFVMETLLPIMEGKAAMINHDKQVSEKTTGQPVKAAKAPGKKKLPAKKSAPKKKKVD